MIYWRTTSDEDEQFALMERESENLEQEFKAAEQSYGTDHLDLVLTKSFLAKLLGNGRWFGTLRRTTRRSCLNFRRLQKSIGSGLDVSMRFIPTP